jgi:hypothetical protein
MRQLEKFDPRAARLFGDDPHDLEEWAWRDADADNRARRGARPPGAERESDRDRVHRGHKSRQR